MILKQLKAIEMIGTRKYLVVQNALKMLISHLVGPKRRKMSISDVEIGIVTLEFRARDEVVGSGIKRIERNRAVRTNWSDAEEKKQAVSM